MIPLILMLAMAQAPSAQDGPRSAALADMDLSLRASPPVAPAKQEKPSPGPTPAPMLQEPGDTGGPGLIDFEWMEMDARIGAAIFSKQYHIDPSPRVGIELRAPLTIFAPGDNPEGDYFGIFTQLDITVIERTIDPAVDNPSGAMLSLTLGLDYSIFRTTTWLLLVRAGFQYASYGGVTDLNDGVAPVFSIRLGVTMSRALAFTFSPEYVRGDGDSIMAALIGLTFDF